MLDKIIKKKIESKNVKIELDSEGRFPKDKYVAVVGEYIIYTSYGAEFNKKIDVFFNSHQSMSEGGLENFKRMLGTKGSFKIIVERNKTKAVKLSKQITKNHYVPMDVRRKMTWE